MKHLPDLGHFALIVALSSTAACVGASDTGGESEVVATAQQAVNMDNALTSNALTSNALTSNALTSNALTSNALTSNALTSNALTSNALSDPAARTLLRYVAGCALPAGEGIDLEIDGQTYEFRGEIGLAKSWGKEHGSCNEACRRWVSACVLARVNYLGEHVPISIRGERGELASSTQERDTFTRREGAYYGDIFASPPLYHACVAPDAPLLPRVCGPSLEGCVMDVVGWCDDACDKPRGDRSFPKCRDHARGGSYGSESGKFPAGVVKYDPSVTVFLQ
jgi:hypothetical protein